ncbi:MAG: DEAD/DEAH box helicase family protein [Legionellales bacterium]|nr:DEAD/DEAH box helicase family protein [Legionellales bacterium]
MNEADTRAELIEPMLKQSGWGVLEGSKILREYHITAGKIQTGGGRGKPLIADYVLIYQGLKLAIIEAKSNKLEVGEGVAQAKNYAEKMRLTTTFSCNGKAIYQICMETGAEGLILRFPTPDELWSKTFSTQNQWRDTFSQIPFEQSGGKNIRYYQEIAVNKTMNAIAENRQRILLTLATGTGKTYIAFQIAWKLFQSRWNLKRDGSRQPRILFLTDRNILADQAFIDFSAFPDDALVRINPKEIAKSASILTNGSVFFTIFQTFMTGRDNQSYFGEYPADFFDFIIIDECHRGGAKDESTWRAILNYFSPAVQLGLTATPKRRDNIDTYQYFGEPVYIYSLKEGVNDGFLTPFKVKHVRTTLDEYIYTSDDDVIEGEVEVGRIYTESDFNKNIEIREREAKRVKIFLADIDQKEKAIVFCATQAHAALVRDLINQFKTGKQPNYCVRVTADDGALGEEYLRTFQDNEKTIPTILTTSQKLSTGVNARNVRSIILMRPINSMIEFKQIIGRGTRLFDGKEYFTIYDFVNAHQHFADPEWDGEPIAVTSEEDEERYPSVRNPAQPVYGVDEDRAERRATLKIRLRNGKEREIQHMIATSFWGADGRPLSAEEFLQNLYGKLPDFFKNEDELRQIWSNPITRKVLVDQLAEAGYGKNELGNLLQLMNAENSDLFDVLDYIAFAVKPITRATRVEEAQPDIFSLLSTKEKEFLEFVLSKYIETGVEELDEDKLPSLLALKYHTISDAAEMLGGTENIRAMFINFQKHLYEQRQSD